MKSDPLYLCISLARTPERWESFKEKFHSKFGITPEKVDAVDAKQFTREELQNYKLPSKKDYLCGRELGPGEIACALSHQKCWKKLLESEAEWALVMEDDAVFCHNPAINKMIQSTSWIPRQVKVIQVSGLYDATMLAKVRFPIEVDSTFSCVKLVDPISYGTQAYWIHRSVVEKALALTTPINSPIDNLMFDFTLPFIDACKVWSLNPYVCFDTPQTSTLEQEREELRKDIDCRKVTKLEKLRNKWNKMLAKKVKYGPIDRIE